MLTTTGYKLLYKDFKGKVRAGLATYSTEQEANNIRLIELKDYISILVMPFTIR